jgi:hypothetical protein
MGVLKGFELGLEAICLSMRQTCMVLYCSRRRLVEKSLKSSKPQQQAHHGASSIGSGRPGPSASGIGEAASDVPMARWR